MKDDWFGVLKAGLMPNAGVHGEKGSLSRESGLGVSKEFRKKFGDVGVLVGVGGSPLERLMLHKA